MLLRLPRYDTLKVEYNTQKKAYVPPKPDPAAQAAMTSLSMQQCALPYDPC